MDTNPSDVEGIRRELAQRDAELSFQRRSLAGLQTLCENVGAAQTVEAVFDRALDVVQELTGHANIALRLYNQKSNCLKLMAQVGMTPAMVAELACLPADWGMMADVVRQLKPVFTTNMPGEPERVGMTPIQAGYKSIVSVPLLAAGRLVGTMEFASTMVYHWSEEELRWLALLGQSVGINVEHVRLAQQVHDLAIARERGRLAQEMHDSLGPLLSTMHVWAEEVQAALADGDAAGAQNAAVKIDSAAQDAYNTLREEILGLRLSIAPGEPFVPVLLKYLDRFQRQWGIVTELSFSGRADHAEMQIEPAHEIQLLRVMQEALTNVRRHARARRVMVTFVDNPQAVTMTIEDDGVGFDASAIEDDRFGIRIMRERAASVEGTLEVRSGTGRGTIVQMQLPKNTRGQPGEGSSVSHALGG